MPLKVGDTVDETVADAVDVPELETLSEAVTEAVLEMLIV